MAGSDISPSAANPPAGFYPDGSGAQRYWNGTAWTEHVQAPAAPAAFGATAPTITIADDDSGEDALRARRKTNGWILAILAAGVIAIVLATTSGPDDTKKSPGKETSTVSDADRLGSGSSTEAGIFCEDFIKQRINRPGDAEFHHTAYRNVPVLNGWIVMGEFDGERRQEFRCEVTHDKAEKAWTLQGLSIDGVDVG